MSAGSEFVGTEKGHASAQHRNRQRSRHDVAVHVPGSAQAEAGALAHRQPCSAASQPQRPLQAQSVVAAGNAFAGLCWQPQEQLLPRQGLQEHDVSRWFMSDSGSCEPGWSVR